MPMIQAAATAAMMMERTPFAIDDAKDDDDDTEDESEIEDDGVLDEVRLINVLSSARTDRPVGGCFPGSSRLWTNGG